MSSSALTGFTERAGESNRHLGVVTAGPGRNQRCCHENTCRHKPRCWRSAALPRVQKVKRISLRMDEEMRPQGSCLVLMYSAMFGGTQRELFSRNPSYPLSSTVVGGWWSGTWFSHWVAQWAPQHSRIFQRHMWVHLCEVWLKLGCLIGQLSKHSSKSRER